MKKLLYSILSLILIFGATSCENWLDVNTNPDSPSNFSVPVETRLPWIQYYYSYAYGSASARTNATAQMLMATSRTNAIGRAGLWNPYQSLSTTPYQNWFVGAAVNIPEIIEKSYETGATHYEAAALVVKSMGYIMMVDLHGEMPYTAAVTADFSPTHDKGEDIYAACLADLDKAIALFQQPQAQGAVSLAAGDVWNGGDVNKWIKLCYGLKARWLNNMSKTSQYNPEEILKAVENGPKSNAENTKMTHYNVETAGTCITVGDAYGPNVVWDTAAWGTGQRLQRWYVNLLTNFKGTGVEDPRADKMLPSSMINVKLSEDGTRIVSYEWLRDNGIDVSGVDEGWLKNRLESANLNSYLTLATGDEPGKDYTPDPAARARGYKESDILKYYTSVDAFVANVRKYYNEESATIEFGNIANAYQKEKPTNKIGNILTDVAVQDAGAISVDVNGDGIKDAKDVVFKGVLITYQPGAMYVNDYNPVYVEDVKYVQLRSDAIFETQGLSKTDMCCYYSAVSDNTRALGHVQGTGSFYLRPDSDTDFLTYSEMCFIKAEVLFRKGDVGGAYSAYKEGILSHFARLNEKLNYWSGLGCSNTARGFDVSFAYAPIPQSDIDAYMTSAAVKQSAGELTLSDIMMQKIIAMGFNFQNWNDVRRYNYFAGNIGGYGVIYTEMGVPAYRTQDQATFDTNPQSDRFYMRRWAQPSFETNYNSTNTDALVNELYGQYGIENALDRNIYSIPVWWDWTK